MAACWKAKQKVVWINFCDIVTDTEEQRKNTAVTKPKEINILSYFVGIY
jgi:hypothetical protein